jgi:hypothetical protein
VKILFYLRRSLASLQAGVRGPVRFLAVCILRHLTGDSVEAQFCLALLHKCRVPGFLLRLLDAGRSLGVRLEMHGHAGSVHSRSAYRAGQFGFVAAAVHPFVESRLPLRRVEVVESHPRSLADRSSKRNGPLVLIHAGGNA